MTLCQTSFSSYRFPWLARGVTVLVLMMLVCSGLAPVGVAQVATAPVITVQPADLAVDLGKPATFSVTATGSAPLSYQWRRGNGSVSGGTNASFTIPSAQVSDGDGYWVTITNSFGSVTSRAARLTLNQPPVFNFQPPDVTTFDGSSFGVRLQVLTSNNSPITWKIVVNNIPITTSSGDDKLQSNQLDTTVRGGPVTMDDNGFFLVVATNAYGSTSSITRQLTVRPSGPAIQSQPVAQEASIGLPVTLSVSATGTALNYQWRKEGADIDEATNASLVIPEAKATDAGNYAVVLSNSVATIISNTVKLTVVAAAVPTITVQPQNTPATVGYPASLSVEAKGSAPLAYQWAKDGTAIPGATGTTLSFSSPALADTGNYTVTVTNTLGSVTSSAAVFTVGTPVAPTITVQPESVTVLVGGTATLSVQATGSVPLTYIWSRNGFTGLIGSRGATFTATNLQPHDGGMPYTVTVSNSAGSVTSRTVYINVETNPAPPRVSFTNVTSRAAPGESASFGVTVTGFPPFTYQWRRNSVAIPGATARQYDIASVKDSDAGDYTCVVTGPGGTVTSESVAFAVNLLPPTLNSSPPADVTKLVGEAVEFSFAYYGTLPVTYQWRRDSTPIPGATNSFLIFNAIKASDGGVYTMMVTNPAGSVTSPPVRLTVAVPNPSRLINLSLLTDLPAGDAFTLGFVTAGPGQNALKPMLIRAVGPTLGAFGVIGPLPDPRLELFRGEEKIASNDNWDDDPGSRGGALFSSVGAFDFSSVTSKDASLSAPTLATGGYSVRVAGGALGGFVLAELYETTAASSVTSLSPRLINVSVLKKLGAGLTAGFVVGGSGSRKILARAVGPGLASFGVTDAVSDPVLALRNTADVTVAANDNWSSADAAAMTAVGAFALTTGSKDAALVATLVPGNYTLRISAVGANATGSVLVEIYEVP